MSYLPVIGITMGDPAGVGPEIIVKALQDRAVYDLCLPIVLGDAETLSSAIANGPEGMSLNLVTDTSEAKGTPGKMDLMPLSRLRRGAVVPGRPNLEGGRAMVTYILKAVEMARRNILDAMVTCPISKILMHRVGYEFDGHTQLIASLTDADAYVMMLAGRRLRVALVTTHCSLKDVPGFLNIKDIHRTILITAKALRDDLGFISPRLAVAGLNPHAGESGLYGSEEEGIIAPAVKRAQEDGIDVWGPMPADTLFYKAASGQFEAVVAMYHDQGLIPLKLLHFSDAVNVTLGLPLIRTSVDHGTAYDIAGTGRADASSLKAAIGMAATMVSNRRKRGVKATD